MAQRKRGRREPFVAPPGWGLGISGICAATVGFLIIRNNGAAIVALVFGTVASTLGALSLRAGDRTLGGASIAMGLVTTVAGAIVFVTRFG